MELHTYAKRKISKKWSIEQKRQLVAARIENDDLFLNQPASRVLPWKKILDLAQLNDYSVFFVRKQWSVMIAKYKQYKEMRLGNIPSRAIDDDIIKKITQEWEFFEPLHRYMTKRTTNLHSYALTKQEPVEEELMELQQVELTENVEEKLENADSPAEPMNVYSSDTNETEYPIQRYTDHDFYSKNPFTETNYSADASEDTQESAIVAAKRAAKDSIESDNSKAVKIDKILTDEDHKQNQQDVPKKVTKTNGIKMKNERDKYYQHKRRYNHRMEKRFDSILYVLAQIAKAEYPRIDVTPLTETVINGAKALFTDEESLDDTDDDDGQQMNGNHISTDK